MPTGQPIPEDQRDFHVVTIRLPVALYGELKRRAVRQERSVSQVLRLLARQYLDEDVDLALERGA